MLSKEIALVSGASRGIGKAIAMSLLAQNATVIGTATSDAGAKLITEYIQASGKGLGLKMNVNDMIAIDLMSTTIKAEYGEISILVNNAAITRDNLLIRMHPEQWDEIIDTNLSALYRLTKIVLKGMMKARKGRIINIASVVGLMGNAGQTNYCAAKAGMIGFTKALAREIGARNITVNAVAPGFIKTDMTDHLAEKQKQQLLQSIPLQRLGDPSDIANAVTFLASPQAAYITGETLNVNGGMYMH